MIEFILIISIYSNAMSTDVAASITTVPLPFKTEEECNAAGLKAKNGLIEGVSLNKSISFVCVSRLVDKK